MVPVASPIAALSLSYPGAAGPFLAIPALTLQSV